jgi:thioester reductase-like protein
VESAVTELTPTSTDPDLEAMRADAVLPDDVAPAAEPSGTPARTVLLTGATGFVGAHLLRKLLEDTQAAVVCLVRPDRRGDLDSRERIAQNLEAHVGLKPEWVQRIRPIEGDLRLPGLGLEEREKQRLAQRIDAIYHGGAAVNWVHPYARLRAANVLGTLELLRLACRGRAKPFHFLSTIGVCYATGRTGHTMTETDDPEPLLGQLHLGYAESKSVAESLVRQARQRGLPAVVYRPTLITGDSRSGAANPVDFLARGIGACIRMGCAPDADWSIDACPVDHIARVVVRHGMLPAGTGRNVLHLMHPQPRHWRELVLWMRLSGYPLQLVPYREWLDRLEQTARTKDHPLRPLLGFFRARATGVTLPETYLGGRRNRVNAEQTRLALAAWGIDCPSLDARWLERFFNSLTAHGVVPPRTGGNGAIHRRHSSEADWEAASWSDGLPDLLRRYFDDPGLRVTAVGSAERLSRQSILTELTSWRCGSVVGLFRQKMELASGRAWVPGMLEVVVKVKAEDRHLLDVAEAAATLCDQRLGEAFARWRNGPGLAGGQAREIALYNQKDERWRRFTPHVYGTLLDAPRRHGVVVLESLGANVWMDSCAGTSCWPPAWIEVVVRGLAQLHAVWFARRNELGAASWLGPAWTAARMEERADLWSALAGHARRYFATWLRPQIRPLQQRLLTRLAQWWRTLEQLPQTLIHNDFNPRNIALRRGGGELVLCAYDWELATVGVPQHDLAELLCFVLPLDCSREMVSHYLELHRQALSEATGQRLPAAEWRQGFGLALADLFVHRLAMYAIVHAIRPQPFLQRVLRTWQTLHTYFSPIL